jgi:uncharacterized membrane protein
MVAPFTDFAIPPLIHSLSLLVGSSTIAVLLFAVRPPVTQRTVLSFVPWIVSGAALHVFYQLGEIFQVRIYPPDIAPLFAAPAVYLTTFILMGGVWALLAMVLPPDKHRAQVPLFLGIIGVSAAVPLIGLVIYQGLDEAVAPMEPLWPMVALVGSIAATAGVYFFLGVWRTYVIARARVAGGLVIFAHLFDAITTTIGVDIIGANERSAIPRAILDIAGELPTADALGTGWLLILLKLVLAVAIVMYFSADLRDHESQTNILFAFVMALGLGPAAHNFFLFILSP